MAKNATSYIRILSGEEVDNGYLLVTKDSLSLFPGIGKYFKLNVMDKKYDSRIEAVDCTCTGQNKPHQHYRISAEYFLGTIPWKRGNTFQITAIESKEFELKSV